MYIIPGKGKMITISNGEWIADLGTMTCRNYTNNIVVGFEKKGKKLMGKIKDMPIGLMEKWAALPHGEKNIENAVMEAEEVFLRAYIEQFVPPK
jgi:hypothetical protein